MATTQIKIGGVDTTSTVIFGTAFFESAVNGQTGSCKFQVRDLDRTASFDQGSTIELLIDGDPVWTGYLVKATRGYVFPALNVTDFGLARFFTIEGVDLNILFTKRIVFNQSAPADVFGKLYPPFSADDDAIADLVADYLDLTGDSLDTSTQVENVADINDDQDARAWSGGYTWGQAMGSIAMLPGAVYFLAPTRKLVYTDVNTATAARGLSDQPGPSDAGYSEMRITKDGSALANDVFAWGFGYGSNDPVFVRDQDAASLAAHGRWQLGVQKPGIYKQATINRVAESIVDGSPSSQRGAKDDRVAVELVTYVPGFLPAQKVDFTSAVFGFSDVIPIRRMRVTFESPEAPKYALSLSHAIDLPWGFFDPFKFTFPRFPPFKPWPPVIGVQPPVNSGIIDDFENRTISNAWGQPSRGLPDWNVYYDGYFGQGGSSGTSTTQYEVAAIGGSGNWGRINLLLTKPGTSLSGGVSVTMQLPIPEIYNWDEFILEFDMVVAPVGAGVSAQGVAFAIIRIGGVAGVSGFPMIDLPFQFEYFGSPASNRLDFDLARDALGGITNTVTENIALTRSFDGHITIDRSVSRGSTLVTVGAYGTFEFSPIEPVTNPNVDKMLYVGFGDAANSALSSQPSNFSIDNIAITNFGGGGRFGYSLSGDAMGFACQVVTAHGDSGDWTTSAPFVTGSEIVFRAGMLQRRGVDYDPDGPGQTILFDDPPGDGEQVFVCYQVLGVG